MLNIWSWFIETAEITKERRISICKLRLHWVWIDTTGSGRRRGMELFDSRYFNCFNRVGLWAKLGDTKLVQILNSSPTAGMDLSLLTLDAFPCVSVRSWNQKHGRASNQGTDNTVLFVSFDSIVILYVTNCNCYGPEIEEKQESPSVCL